MSNFEKMAKYLQINKQRNLLNNCKTGWWLGGLLLFTVKFLSTMITCISTTRILMTGLVIVIVTVIQIAQRH